MYEIDGKLAYETFLKNFKIGAGRFPSRKNFKRSREHGLFPIVKPSFNLEKGASVFTIGSCFARNVENSLDDKGFNVLTKQFSLPDGELPYEASQILNEYNMHTMLQRIRSITGEFHYTAEKSVEEVETGQLDMFLHRGAAPVTATRLAERRAEIDQLYRSVQQADFTVLTLGLVEAWFDNEYDCFLNRAPSQEFVKQNPGRFKFCRLDYESVVAALDETCRRISSLGVRNIVLTVSPVPIEATFMSSDVVVANGYSKAVLRTAAEVIVNKHENVDYFPSYEIVTSRGINNCREDNVHVLPEVVSDVVDYMIENYVR